MVNAAVRWASPRATLQGYRNLETFQTLLSVGDTPRNSPRTLEDTEGC